MKAERITPDTPIEIKITLETEEEAKTLYHLFNRPIPGLGNNGAIRRAIGEKFYSSSFHHDLWDKMKDVAID